MMAITILLIIIVGLILYAILPDEWGDDGTRFPDEDKWVSFSEKDDV